MIITPIGDNFWSFGDGEQNIVLHVTDIPVNVCKGENDAK